jgi:predicted permease
VVCQIALALVLLIGAGLMIRSFRQRIAVDPGFIGAGLLAASVALPESQYDAAAQVRFGQALVDRLKSLPSVAAVAIGSDAPLRGNSSAGILRSEGGDEQGIRYFRHRVSPGYLPALGITLLAGRPFTAADREGQPAVAIVSQAMAQRVWPGADPLGKRVKLSADGEWVTVVGISSDAKFRDLAAGPIDLATGPDLFLPFAQSPDPEIEILVRSRSDPAALSTLIQREVTAIDPGLPVFGVEPMSATLALQTANERFGAWLLALFSALALTLAAVGIYGVLAFVVRGHRKDIAIRMAVGANAAEVVRGVVRQGALLALAGVVLGIALALLTTRVLSALLFGVTATDPATFGAISLLIGVVAMFASYLPARTAAQVDPITVLRND